MPDLFSRGPVQIHLTTRRMLEFRGQLLSTHPKHAADERANDQENSCGATQPRCANEREEPVPGQLFTRKPARRVPVKCEKEQKNRLTSETDDSSARVAKHQRRPHHNDRCEVKNY